MYRAVLLGLAALLPLAAQSYDYSVRVWQTQHGLPQNRIQAMAQTPDGYLWVGTPAGLARFDGRRFSVFDSSNTPELGDNSVLSLAVSRNGGLWIGTEGGGLAYYQNGTFRPRLENVSNGFIRAVYEDPSGVVWIGTDRGYYRRDASGQVTPLDGSPALNVAAVHAILGGVEGRVWASSNQGLLLSVGPSIQSVRFADPQLGKGRAIVSTKAGSLWMTSQHGLSNVAGPSVTHLKLPLEARASSLAEAHDGSIWVGTQGAGIFRIVDSKLTPVHIPALPDQTILSLLEDQDGALWAGTQDGLVRVTRATVKMLASENGLATDHVASVYADTDGSVWIAGANGELNVHRDGKLKPYVVASKTKFRPTLTYRDRTGTLWFGSRLDGLARVDRSGRVDVFNTSHGFRTNSVRQILEDREGRLWIGLGSGLAHWDGKNFHHYYLEDGLVYGSVRAMLQAHDGSILVGTDGGLNRIRGTQVVDDSSLEPLRGTKVWALFEDSSGTVWVGTRGRGLIRLRNGTAHQFTTREGLTANSIHQLLDDNRGNLWMSGPMGIASIAWSDLERNPDTLTVTSYGLAAGLPSTEMSGGMQPVACITPTGELWFASVKGAAQVIPGETRPSRPPVVLLESLRAGNQIYDTSGGSAAIPAGTHRLEITFTASDFHSSGATRFRYKLEGFDNAWNLASQERNAVYTNLPPGNYRFRVASLGASPAEATVGLLVEAHFYQTAWFWTLALFGAGALTWAGLRWYARQTRERYSLLLAERNRLAREMHDTVIQGCVGVSALLEAAAVRSGPEVLLDEARDRIRLTIDEARQAVWDLRNDHPDGGLASSLKDFVTRFASDSSVPIGFEVTGAATRLDGLAERNLLLIAREAIRNALAHASASRIDLRLHYAPSEMSLEVSDDGRGFQLVPEAGHYGIVGMYERVQEMGGDLQIRSAPGRGTTLRARLPLRERTE